MTREQIATATEEDRELQELKLFLQKPSKPATMPKDIQSYKNVVAELNTSADGVILRGQRIVIPKTLRNLTIDLAHTGHQGIVKTKSLVRSQLWFPGIDSLVERKVQRCHSCQTTQNRQQFEPMKPSPMPDGPWCSVAGDFFGPLDDGIYWFVNICEYSRWVTVHEIRNTKAQIVIPILEELFATYGTPKTYKSDNGSPFQSFRFACFAEQWGFKHRRVTPRWPRANGEVERFMKQLGKVLKATRVGGESRNKTLRDFLRAYRATPHSTTKIPPAMLMLGQCRTSPLPAKQTTSLDDEHRQAIENDRVAKDLMTTEYNRRMRAKETPLQVGDQVLAKLDKTRKGDPDWETEPYTVTEMKGSMVTAENSRHSTTRNSSHFKPYLSCEDECQQTTTAPPQTTTAPPQTATAPLSRAKRGRPPKESTAPKADPAPHSMTLRNSKKGEGVIYKK